MTVQGRLLADGVWRGTVIVADDFQVPRGRTLRILAGTRVLVRPADTTKTEPEYLDNATEMLVRGRLLVEGTASRPVIFEPLPAEPGAESDSRWGGIIFDGGGGEIRHARLTGRRNRRHAARLVALDLRPDHLGRPAGRRRPPRFRAAAHAGLRAGGGGRHRLLARVEPDAGARRRAGRRARGAAGRPGRRAAHRRVLLRGEGRGCALGRRGRPAGRDFGQKSAGWLRGSTGDTASRWHAPSPTQLRRLTAAAVRAARAAAGRGPDAGLPRRAVHRRGHHLGGRGADRRHRHGGAGGAADDRAGHGGALRLSRHGRRRRRRERTLHPGPPARRGDARGADRLHRARRRGPGALGGDQPDGDRRRGEPSRVVPGGVRIPRPAQPLFALSRRALDLQGQLPLDPVPGVDRRDHGLRGDRERQRAALSRLDGGDRGPRRSSATRSASRS